MPLGMDFQRSAGVSRVLLVALLGLAVTPMLALRLGPGFGQAAPAPTSVPGAAASTGSKTAKAAQPSPASKRTKTAHRAKAKVAETARMPERPPDPPPPDWPANDPAKPASVDWDGRDLSIAATNASLQQILADVSTATGLKLEGSGADQRVYGTFGPAPARDVLSQLLEGSNYNVLMIGDSGQGPSSASTPPPATRPTGSSPTPPASSPAANGEARQGAEDEAPEDAEPADQQDLNLHKPFGAPPSQPGLTRTPQDIMQEMQQRQQQLQQQQQTQPLPGQSPNP